MRRNSSIDAINNQYKRGNKNRISDSKLDDLDNTNNLKKISAKFNETLSQNSKYYKRKIS